MLDGDESSFTDVVKFLFPSRVTATEKGLLCAVG